MSARYEHSPEHDPADKPAPEPDLASFAVGIDPLASLNYDLLRLTQTTRWMFDGVERVERMLGGIVGRLDAIDARLAALEGPAPVGS